VQLRREEKEEAGRYAYAALACGVLLCLALGLNTSSTTEPTRMANTTDALATVITAFPFDETILAADLNADSAHPRARWWRYNPSANGIISVLGLSSPLYPSGNYQVAVDVYSGTPGTLTLLNSGVERAVMVPVTSGTSYFIRAQQNQAGTPVTGDLVLGVRLAPVSPTIPQGSLVISSDTVTFPYATAIDPTTGEVLAFIPRAIIPISETGAVLPSGVSLWNSSDGVNNGVYLVGSDFSLISGPLDVGTDYTNAPITSNNADTFYAAFVYNVAVGGVGAQVSQVTDAGVVSSLLWDLPTDAVRLESIGVSRDDSILYYAENFTDRAIHRYDLVNDLPLSDLYVEADASWNFALTPFNFPGDIQVLPDGSIVTWQRKTDDSFDRILHLSSAGAVINTFQYDSTVQTIDHITQVAGASSNSEVMVWFFPDVTGTYATSATKAAFARVSLTDGSTISSTPDLPLFDSGVGEVSQSGDYWGPSASCIFLVAQSELGTIQVDKVTVPDGSDQEFDFTAGGGLTPTTFSLSDGESETFENVPAGSGYTIAEDAVAGWSTSITVSNSSPPDNITVAAGETVVVTVTNTQETPEETDDGPCCSTTGPGGAPTNTGYNGTGSTSGTGTTPPTTTPRVIPPGGAAPSYSTCNSGGGTPATASDPVDAQDLTTCKTPLVHMKWTVGDSSVRRYGKRAFTSGNGQAVSARVLRWGGMSQVLSDRHGSFQANQFTVTLSDTDRAIRTILATASTKYVDGKEVEILIESAANAALSVNPLVLARGVLTDYKFRPDMTVDITVTDPLGYRYSSVSIDRPIPGRVCRKELFPNLPEETSGRPQPIIYGEQSDDYAWSLDAARTPVGILPVIYVGPANTISAAGIPGGEWEAFLIAGHAISCVQSIFASNLEDSPGSVRMPTSTYGSEFKVPGLQVPLYYDITGSDGVTERVCLMFATGDRATAHIEGQVPITVNVAGIEDVGNGSGDTISDIALQFQHFLSYFVVQNYLTGSWGAVPTFGDGTAKVRTSSFSYVNAIHAARVGGAYIGGIYIGDQKPAREWAKEFQQGGDMRLGVNHQGQLLVTTLDHTQSTVGLTEFTAQDDMVTQSFQIDPQVSEIFNVYTYEYGVEPATGRKSGLAQTIRHAASITNHGERIAQASVNRCTNRKVTADDVANRALLQSYDAPTDVAFDLDLRGTALTLGQIVKVTHYQGIGALGWTERNLVVTGTTAYPDEDNFSTSIECEDWHDVLALGENVISVDTGTIDTFTIG
jgi:hypothetical protein